MRLPISCWYTYGLLNTSPQSLMEFDVRVHGKLESSKVVKFVVFEKIFNVFSLGEKHVILSSIHLYTKEISQFPMSFMLK